MSMLEISELTTAADDRAADHQGEDRSAMPPANWRATTLGKLVHPRREKSLPSDFPDSPYVGMEHVESNSMRLLNTVRARTMRSAASRFYAGDVLYGRLRPYLNKVYKPDFEGLCSAEFIVFPKTADIDPDFLKYRLNATDFVRFASNLNTGDRPRVDFDQISSFELLLPPVDEQHRIVAEIEKQLTRLDDGVGSLKRAQVALKSFRASALRAGCEGRLVPTEAEIARQKGRGYESATRLLSRILEQRRVQWESARLANLKAAGKTPKDDSWKAKYNEPLPTSSDHRNSLLPEGWTWVTWDQVGFCQNGRPFPSNEYQSSGFKLLRPGNLHTTGRIVWTTDNTRYLPVQWASENCDLIVGSRELVMNLTAQSLKDEFLGRVCLTGDGEKCLLNQRLARLTPVLVLPEYVLYLLKSWRFRRFVDSLNSGSLIQHMFSSQLARFEFPLPPLEEQKRIVAEIEHRLSIVEEVESAVASNLQRSERLRQSILHRAFSGQLRSDVQH
jgi:type I restriction enzyme, S subunit